ncbi:MAG: HEAT repeat domain-containing protein, partial [Planctomycetota bacterium]
VLDLLESDTRRAPYLVRAHAPRTLVQLVTGSIDLTDVQRTQFAPAGDKWRTHVAETLTEMLGKKGQSLQAELRQGATLALGRLGDAGDSDLSKKTRRVLLEASKNSDQQTKWFARIALAQAGGYPAQSEAPFAATRETEEALVRMLVRGPSRGNPWSALALGVLGHLQSQFGLTPSSDVDLGLRDSMARITSPQDLGAYAMASALRGDVQAKSGIFAKLQSVSDDTARGELSVALGLLGAREYVDEIQNLVRESKYRPDLLKQASIALGLLGDKATVSLLTSMLAESESLATQASIATALGFIGDSRSVPPLVELLEDKEQTALARAFAAVALGGVADKETLPWNSKLSVDLQYRASTRTLTGQGVGLLDLL